MFDKKGISEAEIRKRISQGKQKLDNCHSVLWNECVRKDMKIGMYKSRVEYHTVQRFGKITKQTNQKLKAIEMNFCCAVVNSFYRII